MPILQKETWEPLIHTSFMVKWYDSWVLFSRRRIKWSSVTTCTDGAKKRKWLVEVLQVYRFSVWVMKSVLHWCKAPLHNDFGPWPKAWRWVCTWVTWSQLFWCRGRWFFQTFWASGTRGESSRILSPTWLKSSEWTVTWREDSFVGGSFRSGSTRSWEGLCSGMQDFWRGIYWARVIRDGRPRRGGA